MIRGTTPTYTLFVEGHDLTGTTGQATWTPSDAPSLFGEVLVIEGVVGEWVQPGSTNAYMRGDKVTHGGQTWVSTCDNNVWEPGVYGWEVSA